MENQVLTFNQSLVLWVVAVFVVGLMVFGWKGHDRVRSKIARFRKREEVIPSRLEKWERFYRRLSGMGSLAFLILAVLLVGAGFFLE